MVGDLLADNVDPTSVAQITTEVLDQNRDYPRVIAEGLAPHSARFGLPRGDGVALLDHLLTVVNYGQREEAIARAREP
jgi:hypothetical protein